jgi:hypothetical protein
MIEAVTIARRQFTWVVFRLSSSIGRGCRSFRLATLIRRRSFAISSTTRWTREGMATLAASNVAGLLEGYPVWNRPDIRSFLEDDLPQAAPSILNADDLGLTQAT